MSNLVGNNEDRLPNDRAQLLNEAVEHYLIRDDTPVYVCDNVDNVLVKLSIVLKVVEQPRSRDRMPTDLLI